MYIYIYIHVHILHLLHIGMCIYIYIYMYVCIYIYIYIYMYIYIYIYIYIIYISLSLSLSLYIYIYIYMLVYIVLFLFFERREGSVRLPPSGVRTRVSLIRPRPVHSSKFICVPDRSPAREKRLPVLRSVSVQSPTRASQIQAPLWIYSCAYLSV